MRDYFISISGIEDREGLVIPGDSEEEVRELMNNFGHLTGNKMILGEVEELDPRLRLSDEMGYSVDVFRILINGEMRLAEFISGEYGFSAPLVTILPISKTDVVGVLDEDYISDLIYLGTLGGKSVYLGPYDEMITRVYDDMTVDYRLGVYEDSLASLTLLWSEEDGEQLVWYSPMSRPRE